MNSHRSLTCAAMVLAALSFAAPIAAACSYVFMSDGVTYSTSTTPTYYMFQQTSAYWTGIASRAQSASDDWDVEVWSSTAADPTCISGGLANSTQGPGKVDFVVGDFNHNPPGLYYSRVPRYTGSGGAYAQWDDGTDRVVADAAMFTQYLGANDLIKVYDLYLTAGQSYNFQFLPRVGFAPRLLLFRNGAGGTYWAGRSSAVFDVGGCTSYTAPSTGYYGVVVANDLAQDGYFELGVSTTACSCPTSLVAETPAPVGTETHFKFEEESFEWFGVALRPDAGGDWDGQLFNSATGAASPTCFSGLKAASSQSSTVVDFMVGDFSNTGSAPLGWYFPYATRFSGSTNASIEWVTRRGTLTVNDDGTLIGLAATDLAKIYDVYLLAGHTYTLNYTLAPGHTFMLFANPGSTAWFSARSSAAIIGTTGPSTYTAPSTGYYGVVIANDGAVTGFNSVAIGDCGLVTALAADVATYAPDLDHSYWSFNQTNIYWTAIGVRGTSDWEIAVNGNTVASPATACTSSPLASSNLAYPHVDFVVGDFNHNPTGTYYAHTHRFGSSGTGLVQWDTDANIIVPNDVTAPTRVTGPDDLLGCWDVLLTAGQAYDFTLTHGGTADLHLMLFRNPTGGTFWAGRSAAEFDLTSTRTYVAPTTGYYGVVVANDNGNGDTYAIKVANCVTTQDVPAFPTVTTYAAPKAFLRYTPTMAYWTPFATRAASGLDDWDLPVYQNPSGGATGTCFSTMLAGSGGGRGYTDLVVADFNYTPLGTYYASPYAYSGTGSGLVEWCNAGQQLAPGGATAHRTVTDPWLVEAWDTYLAAGHTYAALFAPSAGLDAKVLVFAPTGGSYWAARGSAIAQSTSTVNFTTTIAGYYGIVVVNDGGSGMFNVGIAANSVDVDQAPPPERDALQAVGPNPGRWPLRIDYAIRSHGSASFELLDMAGRAVSRLQLGEKGAGQWSERWDARDPSGRPLPAGLYFVRMQVDGCTVGTRKLTLLQ